MLKDHDASTTGRAYYVNRMYPQVESFGAVVLNRSVGGLDPYVAEAAIHYGAKIVWMPSNHSKYHADYFNIPDYPQFGRPKKQLAGEGVTVFEDDGTTLTKAARTICEVVAEHDVCLATGHLSIDEIRALQDAALEAGVAQRFIVTHANWSLCKLDLDVQRELIAKGAIVEYVACTCTSPIFWEQQPGELGDWITALGGENLVFGSDLGQFAGPPHPEGLRMLMTALLDVGVPYEYLEKMLKVTSAEVLGLEPGWTPMPMPDAAERAPEDDPRGGRMTRFWHPFADMAAVRGRPASCRSSAARATTSGTPTAAATSTPPRASGTRRRSRPRRDRRRRGRADAPARGLLDVPGPHEPAGATSSSSASPASRRSPDSKRVPHERRLGLDRHRDEDGAALLAAARASRSGPCPDPRASARTTACTPTGRRSPASRRTSTGTAACSPDVVEVPWDDAEALREAIERGGPERVAAFFCEPVVGAGGVFAPPPGYLERPRARSAATPACCSSPTRSSPGSAAPAPGSRASAGRSSPT